jgi:hypothetical protein
MNKYRTIILSVLSTITMISGISKSAMAQATATGAVVQFNPNTGFIQSVSGEITIPAGAFNSANPLVIAPILNITPDPTIPVIPNLIIDPGGIDFSVAPTTLNAQIAEVLGNLDPVSDLSELVSILRANPDILSNGTASQAIATGQSTLIYPDGSIQSVSGEISLPTGLYYEGVDNNVVTGLGYNGCTGGPPSGCLLITSVFDIITGTATTPFIRELIVDPGPSNIVGINYDLNATAAQKLTSATDLSDIVSIIRAVSGANGPFSTQVQARAMGMVMIATPDGTTQSVSGEVTLPAGLYFDDNLSQGVYCPGRSCLTVLPDIQWTNPIDSNSAFIRQLTINPGFVNPGDPNSPTGLFSPSSFDVNAAVALKIYEYVLQDTLTNDQLSNIVSVIRAGAGSDGLSPLNRPIARANGSATIVLPNGATQSVSGELSLPNSLFFTGADPTTIQEPLASVGCSAGQACFVLTPLIVEQTPGDPNTRIISSLTVDPGAGNDPTLIKGWDFDAAAAYALSQANELQEQVSIIRAGAGNGLE